MAYNPNMYMPYQPSWTQGVQAPMYNNPIPSAAQPVNGLVSVTGIEGAKAYQMPPNSSMPLFDGNNDILYVKTTDAAGYPTIRTFKFEPMEQAAQPQQTTEYVTRADFDALAAKVEKLTEPKAVADGE